MLARESINFAFRYILGYIYIYIYWRIGAKQVAITGIDEREIAVWIGRKDRNKRIIKAYAGIPLSFLRFALRCNEGEHRNDRVVFVEDNPPRRATTTIRSRLIIWPRPRHAWHRPRRFWPISPRCLRSWPPDYASSATIRPKYLHILRSPGYLKEHSFRWRKLSQSDRFPSTI